MLCRPTLLFFESHHPCGSSKDVRVSFSFSVMEHSYALAAADVGINNKPLVWEASCLPSAKSRFTLRLAEQAMVLHTWRHLLLLLRYHARNKIRWHREHAWAQRENLLVSQYAREMPLRVTIRPGFACSANFRVTPWCILTLRCYTKRASGLVAMIR